MLMMDDLGFADNIKLSGNMTIEEKLSFIKLLNTFKKKIRWEKFETSHHIKNS